MPRPRFVAGRIAMQDDTRDFLPVRAFRLRIEKAQIGDVVPFIIRRNVVSAWRFIIHIGIDLVAQGVRPVRTVYADGGQHPTFASRGLTDVSRPEALASGPVDIALDESKPGKVRTAAGAKPQTITPAVLTAAADSTQGRSGKPIEQASLTVPASEPEKPLYASLLGRLWGDKPTESKAEMPDASKEAPSLEPSTAKPASVPLPPRRDERLSAANRHRGSNSKPQNADSAPAPLKPQADLVPAEPARRAVALLRTKAPATPQDR